MLRGGTMFPPRAQRLAALAALHVLLGASLGCGRTFEKPAALGLGASCLSSSACASGLCADGVCCASACGPTESCGVPGAAGHCTVRPLGAACDGGAACSTGACVDGVCCDQACTGQCQSCALTGQQGHCATVPDGTDPRGACGFACTACYQGTCGPAPQDTNPENRCDVDAGLVCSLSQQCTHPTGSACETGDACSTGLCLAAVCTELRAEEVAYAGFDPAAQHRYVLASSVGREGNAALVVGEFKRDLSSFGCDAPVPGVENNERTDDAIVLDDAVFLLERSPEGVWQGRKLFDSREYDCGEVPSAAAYLGSTLEVALYNEVSFSNGDRCTAAADCDAGPSCFGSNTAVPCGLFLLARSQSGSGFDTVDAQVEQTGAISLAPSGDGRLAIAYDGLGQGGSRHLFLKTRTPGEGWSARQDLGPIDEAPSTYPAPYLPRSAFGVRWLGGEPVVAYLPPQGGTSALALWRAGSAAAVAGVSTSCTEGFGGPVGVGARDAGLDVAVSCLGPASGFYVASVSPDAGIRGDAWFGGVTFPTRTDQTPAVLALPIEPPDGPADILVSADDPNNLTTSTPLYAIGFWGANGALVDLYDDTLASQGEVLDSASAASEPSGNALVAWSTSSYSPSGAPSIARTPQVMLLRR